MTELVNREVITEILEKIGDAVIDRANDLVPVDDGRLKASIKKEVKGNTVRIFSDLDYADAMEYGLPPCGEGNMNEADKEGLRRWAEKHGIRNPVGTIKYIETHGIKVGTVEAPMHITSLGRDSYRPFLRPAVHQAVVGIGPAIEAILHKRLSGKKFTISIK